MLCQCLRESRFENEYLPVFAKNFTGADTDFQPLKVDVRAPYIYLYTVHAEPLASIVEPLGYLAEYMDYQRWRPWLRAKVSPSPLRPPGSLAFLEPGPSSTR
jgi:hypothetical protein